jgi:hypothetical protein
MLTLQSSASGGYFPMQFSDGWLDNEGFNEGWLVGSAETDGLSDG